MTNVALQDHKSQDDHSLRIILLINQHGKNVN